AASYAWTIDTVPPVTTITAQPTALANSAAPSFSFSADKAGSTFECRIDGGAYASCTSPKAYTFLADGAHTFDVRATDPAGNTGAAASASWTSDTTPPATPSLVTPSDGARTNGHSLVAGYSDAGSSGTILFRVCLDAGCGVVLQAGNSAVVASGSNARWTITAPLAEQTYYW